ncbi:MAG: flavodoxin, partial [Proteobacteria bacterium]|nr:flavodoxin [Candidatus Avisuccinivibrio stercorigallinarum]
ALLPEDCTLLKPIGIYRSEVDASRPQLMEWLHGLEY